MRLSGCFVISDSAVETPIIPPPITI